MQSAGEKLVLAQAHLKRVLSAWQAPNWEDLALYGFYCLENAVEAAARHLGLPTVKNHFERVKVAEDLHKRHGLPDVAQLLRDLNEARKAAAYGDVEAPDLNEEEVAGSIEEYVESVERLMGV